MLHFRVGAIIIHPRLTHVLLETITFQLFDLGANIEASANHLTDIVRDLGFTIDHHVSEVESSSFESSCYFFCVRCPAKIHDEFSVNNRRENEQNRAGVGQKSFSEFENTREFRSLIRQF